MLQAVDVGLSSNLTGVSFVALMKYHLSETILGFRLIGNFANRRWRRSVLTCRDLRVSADAVEPYRDTSAGIATSWP